MSVLGTGAQRPVNARPAGGEAGLTSILGAAYDSFVYLDYGTGSINALDRAYQERNSAIHGATGAMLPHPLRQAEEELRRRERDRPDSPDGMHPRETFYDMLARYQREYDGRLGELAEKFPDSRDAIGAGRPIDDDAVAIARRSDERFAAEMASRPGLGKYAAAFVGGVGAMFRDPMLMASLFAGGGPSGARTLAGRVLAIAGKEALINAATEAAMQPSVQAWRQRAGLDHGMDEAIRNVLFAGAAGGALGAVGGAAAEGLARFLRPADTERAAAAFRADPRVSEPARAILAGDGLKAADSLAEIRAALAPQARGALDAAETIRLADEARPPSASPGRHDMALAQADRAVRSGDIEAWPSFEPDPAQVERVVNAIAGQSAVGSRQSGDTPLVEFLIDRGGVQDFRGELAAIGAGDVVERFRGRLVKDKGLPLDTAREAAAEAGYFDHLYGTAEEATAKSTVADLLTLLEEDIRVRTSGAAAGAEAALAGLESTVAEIARHAGPGVDDAVLARAARLSVEDGLDPFDALERVLVGDELAGEATMPPTRDGGIDDPGAPDEDLMIGERDLAALEELDPTMTIPFFDGEDAMTPKAFRDFMERQDTLAAVAEACKA